ncbi:hypothetical protein M5689_013277 [Euphorbia peplus]|nr:hypothetical protein M5689_013277 [Euphorbia peplus]
MDSEQQIDEQQTFNSLPEEVPLPPSFTLPSNPIYLDPDQYKPSQERTPLFLSHFNLQSGLLNGIEAQPHYTYMRTLIPDQFDKLMSHLKEMFSHVNSTVYNVDNHSQNLASSMCQADLISKRVSSHFYDMEGAMKNLSAKMDTLCNYVQEKSMQHDQALQNINNKLDDQHGRIFALQKTHNIY